MSFEQLLGELEELRKAAPVMDDGDGDEKIKAAAADGAGEGDAPGEDDDQDDQDAQDESDEPLGKSMTVTDEAGNRFEALDGTVLVKALQADVSAIKSDAEKDREQLAKALTVATELLQEQGKMLKALQERVEKLAGEGRGRKSTIAAPAGDLQKAQGDAGALSGAEVLAKCDAAFHAGKISGLDVSMVESSINRGLAVPGHILARL